MADKYIATAEDLTSLANSIRSKTETSESLVFPAGFISAISGMQTGLEYESGTWTPSEPTNRADISFANDHLTPPSLFVIESPKINVVSGVFYYVSYLNLEFFGYTNQQFYCRAIGSTTGTSVTANYLSTNILDNFCTNEKITYYFTTSTYFNPIEYKWLAIWLPTT